MEIVSPRPLDPHVQLVEVERWPSEIPLLALVILASAGIWALLVLSMIGFVYALFLGVFFFFTHLVFVTHVMGSAIKLGPDQFPELHTRVVELASRAGLPKPPAAYLLQAGGSLNALATKLFRGRMIVLFSDLLEACGNDTVARDMVIGHEIGHLRAGHLDWLILLTPGRFVPFLGSAYSRAREYTCDRWGAALCGDRAAAARGLAILAAGGSHGPRTNLQAFVEQRRDLDTGWLTIGRWLSSYPPLSARVAAIETTFTPAPFSSTRGPQRAALILGVMVVVPALLTAGVAAFWTKVQPFLPRGAPPTLAEEAAMRAKVYADFEIIGEVVREHLRETGEVIANAERLAAVWAERRPDLESPLDLGGSSYGLAVGSNGSLMVRSCGRDHLIDTSDDIRLELVLDVTNSGARP